MAASIGVSIPHLSRPADFRSDTVTKPTLAMGEAMLAVVRDDDGAALGDDVYGEDETIKRLEREVAALLGKEAAVFVPTCTMANLLAVGAHCKRGDEVVLGDQSHIFVYEQAGASWLMGAPFHTVPNALDGTLPLELALLQDGTCTMFGRRLCNLHGAARARPAAVRHLHDVVGQHLHRPAAAPASAGRA